MSVRRLGVRRDSNSDCGDVQAQIEKGTKMKFIKARKEKDSINNM